MKRSSGLASLTTWSLAALVAGCVLGAIGHATGSPAVAGLSRALEPIGDLWLAALQVLVLPLVMFHVMAVIVGAGDGGEVGSLGVRAVLLFLAMLVAVGLFYYEGYFTQTVNVEGWQQETYNLANSADLPIQQVKGSDGQRLLVGVPTRSGTISAQVWRVDVGRIPLYLLDTNIPENKDEDRKLTARLVADRLTFGASPELVADIRRSGISAWVERQDRVTGRAARRSQRVDVGARGCRKWSFCRGEERQSIARPAADVIPQRRAARHPTQRGETILEREAAPHHGGG